MGKTGVAALAVMTGILLSGCAMENKSTFPPQQSVVYVSKDGGIYTALVEHYDASDTGYSAEELKAMAESEAADYNREYGATGAQESVAVTECTIGEGTALIVYRYATTEDLCRFTERSQDEANHPKEFKLTTNSAYLTGDGKEEGWTDARKNSPATLETVRKKKDLPMVVASGPVTIQTEGRILYYRGAVSLKDEFTAQVEEGEGCLVFR